MRIETKEERDAIRAREEALRAFLGNRCSYKREEAAHLNPPSNEERSAVEVWEWLNEPPDKYFLYIADDRTQGTGYYGLCQGRATTWTGDLLGNVTFGRPYRGNMGDERVPVWIEGTNGRSYQGTYYRSAGSYARIRAIKGGTK